MYRRSLRKMPRKIKRLVVQEMQDDLREIFDRINRSKVLRGYNQPTYLMLR